VIEKVLAKLALKKV